MVTEYETLKMYIKESLCGKVVKSTANRISPIIAGHLIDKGVTVFCKENSKTKGSVQDE